MEETDVIILTVCGILVIILLMMILYNNREENSVQKEEEEDRKIRYQHYLQQIGESTRIFNDEPCQVCGGGRHWVLKCYLTSQDEYKRYYCESCIQQYRTSVALIELRHRLTHHHKSRPHMRMGLYLKWGDNGESYEDYSWNVRMVLASSAKEASTLLHESSWDLIRVDVSKPLQLGDKTISLLKNMLVSQMERL